MENHTASEIDSLQLCNWKAVKQKPGQYPGPAADFQNVPGQQELWKEFWAGVKKGGRPRTLMRPLYKLEAHLTRNNKEIKAYFQKILTGG